MNIKFLDTADPRAHSENIQAALQELTDHLREDIEKVDEPRFQALLETTAEVVGGLHKAFRHYDEGAEKAWRR